MKDISRLASVFRHAREEAGVFLAGSGHRKESDNKIIDMSREAPGIRSTVKKKILGEIFIEVFDEKLDVDYGRNIETNIFRFKCHLIGHKVKATWAVLL
eukprot:snap_masked-scaffold_27-processed-gene-0.27-mRNA-1 protein AED:1.00 eAED:1.00 QI:0/0/0/0/1/1/3/0/98